MFFFSDEMIGFLLFMRVSLHDQPIAAAAKKICNSLQKVTIVLMEVEKKMNGNWPLKEFTLTGQPYIFRCSTRGIW